MTLSNSSFENGLEGFSTQGKTVVEQIIYGVAPTEGSNQLRISTESGAVTDQELETFAGLSQGTLDQLIGANAIQGSAVQITVTVKAGDTLTFDWNFVSREYWWNKGNIQLASLYKDFAFVSIGSQIVKLVDTTSQTSGTLNSNFGNYTGYRSFSHSFATGGSLTVVDSLTKPHVCSKIFQTADER